MVLLNEKSSVSDIHKTPPGRERRQFVEKPHYAYQKIAHRMPSVNINVLTHNNERFSGKVAYELLLWYTREAYG